MVLREMLMRGTMLSAYLYIYANWRIYELPWDSLMTWIVTAILVDFAYYWVHRAAHELNILWAAHQVCIFWNFPVEILMLKKVFLARMLYAHPKSKFYMLLVISDYNSFLTI